jgi:hypothetical protein
MVCLGLFYLVLGAFAVDLNVDEEWCGRGAVTVWGVFLSGVENFLLYFSLREAG